MFRNRFSLSSAILIVLLAGAGGLKVRAQSQSPSQPQQDSTQATQENASENSTQDNQDPLKRKLSDKERFKQQKELQAGVKRDLPEVAGSGRSLDHHGPGAEGVSESEQR